MLQNVKGPPGRGVSERRPDDTCDCLCSALERQTTYTRADPIHFHCAASGPDTFLHQFLLANLPGKHNARVFDVWAVTKSSRATG